jgi:metal-responsive CopG/Arc/MetJ family transcriptional regulator
MGRRKKDTSPITIRLSNQLLNQLDQAASSYRELIGIDISRNDIIRILIKSGLDKGKQYEGKDTQKKEQA